MTTHSYSAIRHIIDGIKTEEMEVKEAAHTALSVAGFLFRSELEGTRSGKSGIYAKN